MKNLGCLLFFLLSITSVAQSIEEEKEKVLTEATKLYKSDMASWYGTDIFMAKFADKHSRAHGYFSYVENGKATCVFFSNDQPRKILATFTFDSTYNVDRAIVEGADRDMTPHESELVAIRMTALEEYQKDNKLFKSYQKMNPNFIPLSDELGKRVYVLTGPQEQGVVVFGNDYLLTFDEQNKLIGKKQLHANIIPIESNNADGKVAITTMHTHLSATGDIMTATDICTLMLYCPFTQWRQHIVVSQKYVSIWSCEKGLVLMPREAWDKINNGQKYLNKSKN